MMSNQLVDISVIEQHKENIQPLPGGRSVSKLATNFNNASQSFLQFKEQQKKEREKFESQLRQFEELDDPLQVYIDYINWTHNNFPQGSNAESGLLSLLERCTSYFRDTAHYKNDPRYLKVWLEYTNYSDSPRDIFVYLAKKEIGNQLALYYEEFAKYLEINGKINDAKLIYELGIESQARPLIRLERSYNHFKHRSENLQVRDQVESSSLMNALTLKRGDAAVPIGASNDVNNPKKKLKLSVYNDEAGDTQGVLHSIFNGNADNNELGSIKSRIKENVLNAKPWAGEIIKQKVSTERPSSRILVFKDSFGDTIEGQSPQQSIEESENGEAYTLIKQLGKNPEKVFVNMELIYPTPEEEYSLPEILAMTRKFSQIKVNDDKNRQMENDIDMLSSDIPTQSTRKDSLDSADGLKFVETNHTFTIPLKDVDNHDDTNLPLARSIDSPTMTIFSKMVTNEVMNMFNNAVQTLNTDDEEERTEGDNSTNYDGFDTETIHTVPVIQKDKHEVNESTMSPADNGGNSGDNVHSSPFIDRPTSVSIESEPKLVNSLDETLRNKLLDNLSIPLSVYPGYHDYGQTKIKKISTLNEMTNKKTKMITKGTPNSIINYCGDENFCLRYELGRGGFGVVYLIETETGGFKALKIEAPSSKWEFYILNQIHRRLVEKKSSSSMFVKPHSFYFFKDESYLVINYFSQGTILDVVNHYRNKGAVIEEVLCIYIITELIKAVEVLHSIGILHGDLKADNCMLRFEKLENSKWSEYYDRDGRNGWSHKSITLIDFGRAIDLTLFNGNVQFISNWKTDQQDCPQMNRNEPWSFEADYYGLATIIHTMLFGKYIKIREAENGRIKLENNLKRYWQSHLWEELFDLLLNPYSSSKNNEVKGPLIERLTIQRSKFEDWLEKNASAMKLKTIIADIEYELHEANRKLFHN